MSPSSQRTTDDSQPAIRATDLTKQFGSTTVVDGLDLRVDSGTVYGFLGPNGAGKTTTMRMLTTLTAPTGGEAAIMGAPVADREAVRSHLGYLPEEPPVFDELTGREQLQYTARLRDIPPAEADARIDEWLDRFDLAGDADRQIDDYSKGMRQKLGLITAVIHEPAVVFLDEPTSGLDPRAARTVLDVIDSLSDAGRTIFLSTHILSVVEELADTVGVLFEGELVAEGPPDELTAHVDAAGGAAGGADAGDATGTLEDVFLAVTTETPAAAAADADGSAADRAVDDGSTSDDENEPAADEPPAGR